MALAASYLNPFKALSKMLASLFAPMATTIAACVAAHKAIRVRIQSLIQCNTMIYHMK